MVRYPRSRQLLGLLIAAVVGPSPAGAESPGSSIERRTMPNQQPTLPAPEFLPHRKPTFELPPVPAPAPNRLGSGQYLFVHDIVITGNTVVASAELAAIAKPYEGREVTLEELFQLKDELTLAYVNQGYVNSGAVLPDQDVSDGVVRLEIIEGTLEAIEITGTRSLDPGFLKQRIRLGASPPLNVNDLQDRLQLLLQDPTIEHLDARLLPGSRPGTAKLAVVVAEQPRRFSVEARAANNQSPSIGANDAGLTFTWFNVLGRNDPLALTGDVTEGLRETTISYSVPLTARDLRFHISGQLSSSKVVNDDVKDLDIESSAKQLTVGFGMPIVDTTTNRLGLDLSFNREHNRTYLLHEPFSFSPGTDKGQSDVSVLQFTQDWQNRGRSRAISLASTFNLGLNILGATNNDDEPGDEPDGQFFFWLGQGQLAHRVFSDRDQLVLRSTVQLSADPLLASQQFSIGGIDSVRGYFANEVVRDNGWAFSLEYRYPLLDWWQRDRIRGPDDASLDLVPFFDQGYGFNHPGNVEGQDAKALTSVGIGLRWTLPPYISAEIYWGRPLTDREGSSGDKLLDAGIAFRLSVMLY